MNPSQASTQQPLTRPIEPPPLSLYVHVPWCVRKCPYCDFNSHAAKSVPEAEYVRALLDDLRQESPSVEGRSVQTVFIGGGTPSLLSGAAVGDLLEGIAATVDLAADAEVTLEANPGTVERARFSAFRTAGVNRLSIGVQSFDDARLRTLGRIHTGREAAAAADAARAAGFDNFNLDLMFGLPDQTVAHAASDLRRAIDLEPAHLSWYQLTLEPNTRFHQFPPRLPDDDAVAAMQTEGAALLRSSGFGQYEVSAFANPGRRCAHNLNYWTFGDYLGIGAGAHGKLTRSADASIERTWKERSPERYLARARSEQRKRPRPGIHDERFALDRGLQPRPVQRTHGAIHQPYRIRICRGSRLRAAGTRRWYDTAPHRAGKPIS
jgi:putative oxygen-independent coproporphyrinogen III oxidase